MELGITGLPLVGKTTLFNALTGERMETGTYSSAKDAHLAVVKVPDERLDVLAEKYQPKKKTAAEVRYVDVAGVVRGGGAVASSGLLAALKTVDALIHVVRAFESDTVPLPEGGIDPKRDIADFELELMMNDLELAERRLERIERELRSGKKESAREHEVLAKCRDALSAERPLRTLSLPPDEEKIIRGFQFLTRKPVILVINIGENDIARAGEIAAALADPERAPHVEVIALCAEIEMEISQLDEADQPDFLADLGIPEPAVHRLIRVSYHLLDLVSFFTVGPDEVRAWTVRKGALAPEAAGAIHTDLERGFIRAEVVHYDDLIASGGMTAAKEKGLVRVEGKSYEVTDGDILNIRFSV